MNTSKIITTLKNKGLKITPQRVVVFESVLKLSGHPTAEQIIKNVRKKNPNISAGTIYKTLETFVQNKLINKVKTDEDVMRYDSVTDKHHHLYCSESDRIEDFYDKELNELIQEYLQNKQIRDFNVKDFKLQIVGEFKNKKQ